MVDFTLQLCLSCRSVMIESIVFGTDQQLQRDARVESTFSLMLL